MSSWLWSSALQTVVVSLAMTQSPWRFPRRWSGGHGRSRASRGRQVLQTNRSIIDGSGCNSLSGASWLKPSTILTHDGYSCEEGENMFLLTWLDRLKLTYKNSQEYFARIANSVHSTVSVSVCVPTLHMIMVIGKSMYCSEVHGGDRGWALGQRLRTT